VAPKIAVIGAGSTVFARNLIGDLLRFRALADGTTLALMDIDHERLATSEVMARRLADACGAAARIEATADRRAALDGADYVITCFQVGGLRPATTVDFTVPQRYGVRQTIADTLGIGGIMRGLRTIPVLLGICRDMEELCPDALLLQYVNPMAMLCWAVAETSRVRTVGLCHSVQHTAGQLAAALEVDPRELDYVVAGINHVAFFLSLERDDEDLYPRLRELVETDRVPAEDRVRFAVLRHLGYFVTESSEHFAEYVPWFIKSARPDLIDRFAIPLDKYPRRCDRQIEEWSAMDIINACETGEPFRFNGNVPNARAGGQLIDNLPGDCCVEVPCVAGERGIEPRAVGALPRHLAALIQTNVNVQGLTVSAALTGRREPAYHAAMLDPHTAAELPLDEIEELVDELLWAHGDLVPPLVL
jgi:alpha-galactosidase